MKIKVANKYATRLAFRRSPRPSRKFLRARKIGPPRIAAISRICSRLRNILARTLLNSPHPFQRAPRTHDPKKGKLPLYRAGFDLDGSAGIGRENALPCSSCVRIEERSPLNFHRLPLGKIKTRLSKNYRPVKSGIGFKGCFYLGRDGFEHVQMSHYVCPDHDITRELQRRVVSIDRKSSSCNKVRLNWTRALPVPEKDRLRSPDSSTDSPSCPSLRYSAGDRNLHTKP